VRILLSLATAISILAVTLLILFTPVWTHFALDQSHPNVCTPQQLCLLDQNTIEAVSDQTISAVLVTGEFSFRGISALDVGPSFYTDAEQSHMRDVRAVFYGFMVLAVASLVFVVAAVRRARRDAGRWTAVARGSVWLVVGLLIVGIFAFVAFDDVFTVFHEIFFPGGNWAFGPGSNLIWLYPELFWELTSAALFGLSLVGALIVWFVARRRADALTRVAVTAE
jgi:integral membrane protein (TIGR01906 family)